MQNSPLCLSFLICKWGNYQYLLQGLLQGLNELISVRVESTAWHILADATGGLDIAAVIVSVILLKIRIEKWFSKAVPQVTRAFFCRNRKLHPKNHMKFQGVPNSQNNLEKEEQIWIYHTSSLQNLLQSYSNQNRVVPPSRQKQRPME